MRIEVWGMLLLKAISGRDGRWMGELVCERISNVRARARL